MLYTELFAGLTLLPQDDGGATLPVNNNTAAKTNRPSLPKILLSMEGGAAKQQALSYILQALQIKYTRYTWSIAIHR